MTVGGGIRSLNDVELLLAAGADRVCINTAAVKRPELISEVVKVYGSSTLVIAVEAIKENEEYMVFTDNGREQTGLRVSEWVKKVEELGAGEILLTCVDQEGTRKGFDIELLNLVRSCVGISIIVHGGIGSYQEVYNIFNNLNIDAVCLASLFHYDTVNSSENLNKSVLGNKSFLLSNKKRFGIESISVKSLKDKLKSDNIRVR